MFPVNIRCDGCGVLFPVKSNDPSCSVDWITYPDGVRLPAIPCWDIDGCQFCGVERDRFHHTSCINAVCPRCFGKLTSCDCLNSENLFPRRKMDREEIANRINEIASEYTGVITKLDDVIQDTTDAILWAKLSAFEELIVKFRAGNYILDRYPDVLIRKWKENGNVPAFIRNAELSVKYARDLWFRHFWR